MTLSAFISGCRGTRLSDKERAFFRETRPCGLILFKRNCEDREQVRALVSSFHDAVGEPGALVLIDQEGGRVQRLKPPHWRQYPPARAFGVLYERDPETGIAAAAACARLIASDLREVGVTVNCAPVADVPVPGAHEVIGDRAYSTSADIVGVLAKAVAQAYLQAGVLPVIKHIPGHGRAQSDSHKALPVIAAGLNELRRCDFPPFITLKEMPLAMTAHVLVPAVDQHAPASTSPEIVREVIRGEIGFDGLLMCDDISMRALKGPIRTNAEAVLAAGCDVVLHCNGDLHEMEAVASAAPELTGKAGARFEAALACLTPPEPQDPGQDEALLRQALAVQA